MIDWLTLRLWCGAPVDAGCVYSVTADGEIEWQTPKRFQLPGSHASSVSVRRFGYDNTLEISGNPAKWFQGHNVFGTDDLRNLSGTFAFRVLAGLGYQPTEQERRNIEDGLVTLTRIDVTESWDFGSQPRALAVLRAMSDRSHLKHRGRGSMLAEGTVMWRQGSRRLSAKAYSKGLELAAHQPHPLLPNRQEIIDSAAGLVRFEFTLRSMWLKDRKLDLLQNWVNVGVTPQQLHRGLMDDLSISDVEIGDTAALKDLPPRLQAIYQAWLDGHDVRQMFKSVRTFYRYRAQLLPLGCDLATVRPGREVSNVVPLRVVLTGKPFEVPAWAKGTPLYFEPKAA